MFGVRLDTGCRESILLHVREEVDSMLHGSCVCGKVQYRIGAKPLVMYFCHCGICRAASGAGFATNVAIATTDFRVTGGSEALSAYESSPGKLRYFCSSCGSPIYSQGQNTSHYVAVRCGTLHDDPGIRPSFHAFVGSKAPWVTITDNLPQFSEARGGI